MLHEVLLRLADLPEVLKDVDGFLAPVTLQINATK